MKLEIKNVSKEFKNNEVIKNVNVVFESGKIYALIGRNGSGKSVLLKMVCGFYEPTSGEILQDGENYIKQKKFPLNTRCLIEKPNFLPELSGLDNLKVLASIENKITINEIISTLEIVNLKEDMNKRYGQYSLGMKQKLGIAQVLMENPEVLILDEPFNGIEKETAVKLRNHLRNLAKAGKIIIVASHIEEDIKGLSDVVYEIRDGMLYKKRERVK